MNSIKWSNDFNNITAPTGKRVDVCLSGQTRLLDSSVNSIKENLIKPYGADEFIDIEEDIVGICTDFPLETRRYCL